MECQEQGRVCQEISLDNFGDEARSNITLRLSGKVRVKPRKLGILIFTTFPPLLPTIFQTLL